MSYPRGGHTATLLSDGRVLAVGTTGNSSTTRRMQRGLSYLPAWRPAVTNPTPISVSLGQELSLHGSKFRGGSEGSGGNSQNSSSGVPLVQVRRMDNEQVLWLRPDGGFSDSIFTSVLVDHFPQGPVLVTVFGNGVPSESRPAVTGVGSVIYLPLTIRNAWVGDLHCQAAARQGD